MISFLKSIQSLGLTGTKKNISTMNMMRMLLKSLILIFKIMLAAFIVAVGSVVLVVLFTLILLVFTFNQLPRNDLIGLTKIMHWSGTGPSTNTCKGVGAWCKKGVLPIVLTIVRQPFKNDLNFSCKLDSTLFFCRVKVYISLQEVQRF